jgi:hypothetical protein
MSKIVHKYKGKEVSEAELDLLVPRKADWLSAPPMVAKTYTEHDPWISDGCGVMKSQVDEARSDIKKHNIQGAAVLPDGRIRCTSKRARNEWLRHRGLHDMDGGYGDE